MRSTFISILFVSQLFASFSYISPGISIGKNNHDELFIAVQISLGTAFWDDHINDIPINNSSNKFIDYFVPSISFGIKYFPKKLNNKILSYADFQTTIWTNIGVIGYGVGFNKNMADNSFRIKTKSYLGYMLLYLYEKEKNNDYVDKSLMFVIPTPFEELFYTGENYNESTNEP